MLDANENRLKSEARCGRNGGWMRERRELCVWFLEAEEFMTERTAVCRTARSIWSDSVLDRSWNRLRSGCGATGTSG